MTKLEEKFVTKEDLKKTEKKFTDLLIDFKDAILKEIKNLRDDVALVTGYKDQIEDHDYRIERLEKHTKIPPMTTA